MCIRDSVCPLIARIIPIRAKIQSTRVMIPKMAETASTRIGLISIRKPFNTLAIILQTAIITNRTSP